MTVAVFYLEIISLATNVGVVVFYCCCFWCVCFCFVFGFDFLRGWDGFCICVFHIKTKHVYSTACLTSLCHLL